MINIEGDGSTFLQLGSSIEQQINGMFKVMEEYNWDSFVVVTSMYPGYDTYVDYIHSFIDTSYFLWELQDILTFDMSADGMNDLRARRLLQQIDAQVLLVYCSHDEAQYLFSMAREVGLVGPGYIWFIPSLAVGNPNMPPPDSFPVGLISIITDRWKMSLRNRVRDGVAIVVKGVESFRKQRGFIPDGHMDCQSPQFSVAGPKSRVLTLLHIAQSVPSGFRYRDQSEDITCDVPFLARAAQKSNLVPSVPGNTTNPISSENVLIIQWGPEFERPRQRKVLCVWCSPRHMLNVSWENTDFSFNSDGYLVNPSMIIITLDRGRQWDKGLKKLRPAVFKQLLAIDIFFRLDSVHIGCGILPKASWQRPRIFSLSPPGGVISGIESDAMLVWITTERESHKKWNKAPNEMSAILIWHQTHEHMQTAVI
ncbi:Glutamate receptor ionotropic, NMDA 2C [Labeo rohita]|uniref:Glutamate receptor ionotropic, NMDA 2C n=1 Tax=Labeo rohita TaxID=84645 RepID=A0ABQ8MUQ6_LABRO|nr:Glutamate receptor ionotropic, NMDA 2C [Labeo rohita]